MKIAIVGAGPAGLAAARILSEHSVSVDVFDQYPRAGGQYWRHAKNEPFPAESFKTTLTSSRLTWLFECSIWQIESEKSGYTIYAIQNGRTIERTYDALLIATGAIERPLPIPGWTLPGVMTAGALQSLIKGQGLIPGERIVVAGSGPFLFPVIESLQKSIQQSSSSNPSSDIRIVGIFEARKLSRWLLNSVGLLLNPEKVIDAMRFLINLKRKKLRVTTGRVITSINDTNSKNVKRISVMPLKGEKVSNNATAQELDCDVIAISYGFTPDLTIPSILKLKTVNKEDDEIVMVDSNQRSSKLGVWAAGEITGIGGHELAIREGEIAALDILGKGGSLTSAIRKIDRWRKQIFASGLARVYKVSKRWFEWNADDVVVCRCEEVSRDEIINSFRELGADSVRTSKLFTRAGMGMCQGRLCHRNVQDIARVFGSESTKISRPIGGAVTLGELSD